MPRIQRVDKSVRWGPAQAMLACRCPSPWLPIDPDLDSELAELARTHPRDLMRFEHAAHRYGLVPRAASRDYGERARKEATALLHFCRAGREGKRPNSTGPRVLYPRDVMPLMLDTEADAVRWAAEELDAIDRWLESLDQEEPNP